MRRPAFGGFVIVAVAATAACNSPASNGDEPRTEQAEPLVALTSIVQLGDSVASGEGTLYGYQWDPGGQDWIDGNIDAEWPEPYPDCHTSQYAYGNIVAAYFGAELEQYACTGTTFANGITTARTSDGTEYRPAEFGNWDARTELNPDYDEAAPQLVLITLGADDLQFSSIVEDCVENAYEYYWDYADLECIDSNPGSTIETDFVGFLDTLKANYGTLVESIEARAKANAAPVPKIVFTNYANPLPPDGTICTDTNYFYAQQVKYLSSLVDEINTIIEDTISALGNPDVAVADISQAYSVQGTSHIWCSDDPWAYGLSIYSVTSPSSFDSQAPFHPTPDGQESIAEHIVPVVRQWFAKPADEPAETTTSSTGAPPTTG